MSVTALEIFGISMDLIDERLENGTIDEDATADYKARALGILTALQNELLRYSDYYKTYEINRVPISPIKGQTTIEEHYDEDIEFEATQISYAYFFQVDGPATVYVEELNGGIWSILDTIVVTENNQFIDYKGLITPTVGATSTRLRFTGDYYFTYTNVALYKERFSSVAKVPNYEQYIQVEMPDDFKIVDQVVKISLPDGYVKTNTYYWEGRKDMYINRDFEGSIKVIYRPNIAPLTSIDDELVLDDVTAITCLPYGLGAKLMATENVSLGSYLQSKYEENKYEAGLPTPSEDNDIEDVYDWTLGYYGG